MAKAKVKKVNHFPSSPPPRYARAKRLLLELLYLYCVSTGVAAVFALVHHLTGLDRPIVLWGCAEVFFFLYHRWRYFQLHANPAPTPILISDDDHFQDFLTLRSAIDLKEFLSGWFFHKDISEIKKGNVFDFVAYAFLYKRRSDLTPKEAQRVNKWVEAIQLTYNIRFKEGYNHTLDFMAHIFHPLQVMHKPLVWHIISEMLGVIPHALLWLWGFHHHFYSGFSFWVADKHAVCSLPLVVAPMEADKKIEEKFQGQLHGGRCNHSQQHALLRDQVPSQPGCSCCCQNSKGSPKQGAGGAGGSSCRPRVKQRSFGGGGKGQGPGSREGWGGSTGVCGCQGSCGEASASSSGSSSSSSSSSKGSRGLAAGGSCYCGIGAQAPGGSMRQPSGHSTVCRSLSAISLAELAMKYTPTLPPTFLPLPSSFPSLPSWTDLPSMSLPSMSLPSLPSSFMPSLPTDLYSLSNLSCLPCMQVPSSSFDIPTIPSLPFDLPFDLPSLPFDLPSLPLDLSSFPFDLPSLPLDLPSFPRPSLQPLYDFRDRHLPSVPLSSLSHIRSPSLSDLPSLPSLSDLPSLPSLSDLPSLPTLPTLPTLPSLSSLSSLAPWSRSPPRPPPPDSLPIVFVHGVGFGLLPYLLFLRSLMKAHPTRPVILVEVRQVALRYCHTVADFDSMASSIVDMLRAHGYTQGSFVAHSFGTFVVTRVCQQHPEVVHSTVLIDPVSMLLCVPKTLHNFIYAPPLLKGFFRHPVRTVVDVARWLCARDMGIAQTFCRGFYWHKLSLWPRQMKRNKSLVVLSGEDDLVPTKQIKAYLEEHGEGVRVIHHPGQLHGMFLLKPKRQQEVIEALGDILQK